MFKAKGTIKTLSILVTIVWVAIVIMACSAAPAHAEASYQSDLRNVTIHAGYVVAVCGDAVYLNLNGDIYGFYGDGFAFGDYVYVAMWHSQIVEAFMF